MIIIITNTIIISRKSRNNIKIKFSIEERLEDGRKFEELLKIFLEDSRFLENLKKI